MALACQASSLASAVGYVQDGMASIGPSARMKVGVEEARVLIVKLLTFDTYNLLQERA